MQLTAPEMLCHIRENVERRIGANRFKTWFGDSTGFELTRNHLDVSVPNEFIGRWIATNFLPEIVEATRDVIEADPIVNIRVITPVPSSQSPASPPVNTTPASSAAFVRAVPAPMRPAEPRPQLRGDLHNFVRGPGNELAYVMALEVVRVPGQKFKHLLIHGGCGLGKTHLLHGVCNGIRDAHPALEWRYLSGEEFTNEFVQSVKSGRGDIFRSRFRTADVLVIDDIHFLANKRATQEEFLHTFNAIDAGGKTIVMSSDRHPRLLTSLSEPLVDRLIAATVVQIDTPDFATRREIVRRRALAMRFDTAPETLDYVAEHVTRNVRELEGALYKLAAMSALAKEPLSLDSVKRALADLDEAPRMTPTAEIESRVSEYFGITRDRMRSKSRDRTVALARAVGMFLIRRRTALSFPEIARATGQKNHSTVLMAAKRIEQTLSRNGAVCWRTPDGEREVALREVVDQLEQRLG